MFDCNHILDVLATSFFETLGPTRCVVCDTPGAVLCNNCAAQLPYIDLPQACPRCAAPFGAHLCTECPLPGSEEAVQHPEHLFPFSGTRAALSYERGAKRIIKTYKDGDELRLDMVIASLICRTMRGYARGGCIGAAMEKPASLQGISQLDDWTCYADAIVPIPASDEAVRRRGFDHMERIGCLCSAWTGLPLERTLVCNKKTLDQRELGRDMRFQNRGGSFTVREGETARGHIILIDDVFTTGATSTAAASALLDAGAQDVHVAVCARVW